VAGDQLSSGSNSSEIRWSTSRSFWEKREGDLLLRAGLLLLGAGGRSGVLLAGGRRSAAGRWPEIRCWQVAGDPLLGGG
jgi:hypothetical protein